ncbi:Uncharacterised protein [Mycobacteroides abscessus subsp. abscessus]|nr:Uncharacterised protein [Mycobacteroides abscessus subsp. abscessus]
MFSGRSGIRRSASVTGASDSPSRSSRSMRTCAVSIGRSSPEVSTQTGSAVARMYSVRSAG